jgi:phosphatidyl-N-methylethanolamine N-methyltransferase
MVHGWLLAPAAALLAVERLTYVWIWRAPETFRAWCLGTLPSAVRDPVTALAALFALFKALQVTVFVIWCYVHAGGSLWWETGDIRVLALGTLLMSLGQVLNLSVFARLGRIGVFYGNRLGHTVPWCRRFPFTWFSHPQYVGTVLSIWGFFVFMRFPAEDWLVLPVLETFYYVAGAWLEQDHAAAEDADGGAFVAEPSQPRDERIG